MTIIEGACHCGNLRFVFQTAQTEDMLPIRCCQCSFCRAHGAATARDPEGTARIQARDPRAVTRYRFATGSTDFVLCATCGIYVGAVITHDSRQYATLNMRLTALETSRARPVSYDAEAGPARIARRIAAFTPLLECPF